MKFKLFVVSALILFSILGLQEFAKAQGYCQPTSYTNFGNYISSVKINKYTHTSKGSANGYDSSTITSTKTPVDSFLPGKSYTITAKGSNALYFGIWVDWNNDGDFNDAGEFIDSSSKTVTSITSTIKVPKLTIAGTYRIRVRGFGYSSVGSSIGACNAPYYNYGETEDYLFYVKSISINDAGVTQIISPGASGCGDSTTKITLVIGNFGTNALSKIPVVIEITPKAGKKTTFTDTLRATLNVGQTDTFTFSTTYNTFNGSQYSMVAYSVYPKDTFTYNDTSTRVAGIFSGVETPITKGSSLCKPGKVKLYNSNNYLGYNTFWYNSRTSNIPIATPSTDTFYTPVLNTTTTYYAVFSTAYVYNLGAVDNSIGAGNLNYTTFTNGEIFDASSDFTLDSVTVYANSSGKVSVNLVNSAGNTIKTVTVSVASSGKHQLFVNMFVPKGTGYTLNAANSTVTGLYRNSAGASYPYSASGVLDITNNTINDKARWYFFYDWVVTGPGCYSKRDSFTVNIGGPVAALKQGTPFKGFFGTGIASAPDTAAVADTVRYIISPPSGYTNADYGTKWTISNVKFVSINGSTTTDTALVYPTSTSNGTFTFFPSLSLSDSTYELSYKISTAGCDSTLSRYMYVIGRPSAAFSVKGSCGGAPINFTNKSTGKGGLSSFWDFGDGTTSTMTNPLHQYTSGGTYTVKLKVTASKGAVDSMSKSIFLFDNPVANFWVKNTCLGQNTQFMDSSSISSGSISKYAYDFGDGSPVDSNASTAHTFTSEDVFSVTMTLMSDKGCMSSVVKNVSINVAPVPAFTTNVVCEGSPTIFTNNTKDKTGSNSIYLWQMGDGSISTDASPTHSYTGGGPFTAWLFATNIYGCSDSTSAIVTVHAKPATKFGAVNTCIQEATKFIDSSSISSGSITNYQWDFGDSTFTYSTSPSHKYINAGNYTVSLSQQSDQGCNSKISKTITIGTQPDAGFNYFATDTGITFLPVNSSYTSYSWDFGDSSTSTSVAPIHAYKKNGTYTVVLNVLNGSGPCNSSAYSINLNTTGTGIQSDAANAIHLLAFPNPFSDKLEIDYTLATPGMVNATLYDITGRAITTLVSARQIEGNHTILLNTLENGMKAGVYLLRMDVNNSIITERLIMVK